MKSVYRLLGTIALFYAPMAHAQVDSNFAAGGGVRMGWSSTTCDSSIAGSIRYNSSSGGSIDYCNGATWQKLGGSGGTPGNPTRSVQFNSGGSFTGAANFVYTATNRLGIGTAAPSYAISLTGTGAAQSIGMENETTATTDGRDLNFYAGGASGGNNRNGGDLDFYSGRATGHGSSYIQLLTVMPGQGSNTTIRNPALSMTIASNALSLPSGTTAQRPGSTDMQAVANGMIRYNTQTNKFEGYQNNAWIDLIHNFAVGGNRTIQFNNVGNFDGDATFVYTSSNRIGLGTGSPSARMDIEGAMNVGNNGETCELSADRGSIRYNGNSLQICNDHNIGWENIALAAPIVSNESCDATRTISTPGTYTYKIPSNFGTITIRIWGGGGGGGSAAYINQGYPGHGVTGGTSSITSLNLMATGGVGGRGIYDTTPSGAGGAGGTATGGDTNTNGNTGANGVNNTNSGAGANAPGPGGGTGGGSRPAVAYTSYDGLPGNAPGGGGGGAINHNFTFAESGGGGSGAYLEKIYTNTALTPGTIISGIVVGAGGAGGNGGGYNNGGAGGAGRITINCVSGPPPSGLVALDDLNDVTITTPSNGQALVYNGSGWVNGAGGGGGGSAAGLNTQIQFNSGGSAFGASSGLTWNQGTSKFTVTGDIEYTGTMNDISDQRLKANVTPLSSALAHLKAMTPVSFTMKADPKNTLEYGFIAQDIEKIYPALVKTDNDTDHTKSMNYIGLIAPMVKTLQEQQHIMQKQRQTLADQKSRVEALEKSLNAQHTEEK